MNHRASSCWKSHQPALGMPAQEAVTEDQRPPARSPRRWPTRRTPSSVVTSNGRGRNVVRLGRRTRLRLRPAMAVKGSRPGAKRSATLASLMGRIVFLADRPPAEALPAIEALGFDVKPEPLSAESLCAPGGPGPRGGDRRTPPPTPTRPTAILRSLAGCAARTRRWRCCCTNGTWSAALARAGRRLRHPGAVTGELRVRLAMLLRRTGGAGEGTIRLGPLALNPRRTRSPWPGAARPHVQGVRAAPVPGSAARAGVHPSRAAAPGLGLRLLRRHPDGRRPRPAPAGQAGVRARVAHPDRPRRRVPGVRAGPARLTGRRDRMARPSAPAAEPSGSATARPAR